MFELPVSELDGSHQTRRRRPRNDGRMQRRRKVSGGAFGWCSLMRASICCIAFLLLMIPLYLGFARVMELPDQQLKPMPASHVGNQGHTFDNFALSASQFHELDATWTRALAEADVIRTIQIPHLGLAKKYVFLLEGDFVAMAKPLERDLFLWPRTVFTARNWYDEQASSAVRMDREYQGWGELAGLLLDRVLELRRKPPIVGRYLPSELLYEHDYSVLGRLLYALPSRPVAVSMHAWVHGMSTRPPSNRIGDWLRLNSTEMVQGESKERMLEYSDVIVFDFLVDDHDRFGSHNWKASEDGKLLVWDSGLAWNYGPVHENLEILCGTHQWNEMDPIHTPHYAGRPNCKRVCRFRRHTIDTLRSFGRNGKGSLGEELQFLMEEDALHPIFYSGMFKMKRTGFWWLFPSATRFVEQNFFDGIDERVGSILQHVDTCIQKYGEEAVLQSA